MHRRARRSMSTQNLAHAFEAIVMATAAPGACLVACGGTTVSGAGSDGNPLLTIARIRRNLIITS